MRMPAWGVVLGGAVLVAAAACGGSGGSGSRDVEPGRPSLVGETDQRLHLRVDVVADGRLSLRIPADCAPERSDDLLDPVHTRRSEAELDGDGDFAVDEAYVEDGTDGDETHVELRIDGEVTDDGTVAGTIEMSTRRWSGVDQEFGPTCESGTVSWTADRPPAEGDNLVVPTPGRVTLAPAGNDVLARTEAGEVLRVDAAAGELRRLDGSSAGGPPPTEADPNVPTTVTAGGFGPAAAPLWLDEMAVVGGGVWTPDPATGVVTRFELDSGARTATIGQRLDAMAAGHDALWTVSTRPFSTDYTLERRDPVSGEVVAGTPVERGVILVGPSDVWYADATWDGGRLRRVDPATLAFGPPVAADVPLFGDDVVHTGDRVWWIELDELTAVDLTTGRVEVVDLPFRPVTFAGDAGGVWVVDNQQHIAHRIEGDRIVHTVDLPDDWWHITVSDDGAVWLNGSTDDDRWQIVRLDPSVTG